MAQIDFERALIHGGVGFIAGGGQRMAWEASETIGLVTTGAALVAGLAVPMFVNNRMILRAADAVLISAASTGGWVASEKFMIEGSSGRRTGHLPAQQRIGGGGYSPARQAVYSGNGNGMVHRAMIPYEDGDVTVL